MLSLELHYEDGTVIRNTLPLPLEIGRTAQSGLRLNSWRVARRHACIEKSDDGLYIDDFGSLSGTVVNGRRISRYGPLLPGHEIIIGPCRMVLRDTSGSTCEHTDSTSADLPPMVDSEAHFFPPQIIASGTVDHVDEPPFQTARSDAAQHGPATASLLEGRLHHRRRLHLALLQALDLRRRDIAALSDEALRAEATRVLTGIIQHDTELDSTIDRDELGVEVVNEAVGLGPLEPLLADPSITEIMVNRYDEIFVESAGRLSRHPSGFSSEQAVQSVIERIVSPLGRRIDESSPMVDARLRDGSRVNAIIPPIALRGASLTIRKFPQMRPGMDDLVCVGALDASMRTFLETCVAARKNIVVSGGTGSGKTTLLNVLSNCIPEGERIVTIEDAAELRLDHQHLVTLEARPANLEGRGRVEIRDLVRNALRMRPDRIVIGECRGGEAFDMLAAMNTGHEGSLTTLHANSPRDALGRLETMILMAGMDLPLAAVREHIASSIDLIVQQVRLSDGRRIISSIVEVTGLESGRIQTQPIFEYDAGPPPAFSGCAIVPELVVRAGGEVLGTLGISLFSHRTEVRAGNATFASVLSGRHPTPSTLE